MESNIPDVDSVEQAIKQLKQNYFYYPDKNYQLVRQVKKNGYKKLKEKREKPQNFRKENNQSLKKLNSEWNNVSTSYLYIPEEHPTRTDLHDLQNQEDFKAWFEEQFSGLKNGVYSVVKGAGYARGFIHFFLLHFKDGEVVNWRKTSSGTAGANESTYYAFPYYFRIREENNI